VKVFSPNNLLLICLYVDDLLVTGDSQAKIELFKHKMNSEFEMSDLGRLNYFLGLEFKNTSKGILMHQRTYISGVLSKFHMADCNSVPIPVIANLKLGEATDERLVDATLYKQVVGSLRYVCNSRPNISYGVGLVSRFINSPRTSYVAAVKHMLKYLKGTTKLGLFFPRKTSQDEGNMEVWTDSDWCGERMDRRSTFGYFFKYMHAPISWCSKKQNVVALSSCEAEYIASVETACQCLWLSTLIKELKLECREPIQLLVDNKSTISLSKNLVCHGRSKHIETKFHFLRDQVCQGRLELVYCPTENQVADVFTKALRQSRFERLRDLLGLKLINILD